jgi:hypothetical protein
MVSSDAERDCYICPAGCDLLSSGRVNYGDCYRYVASVNDWRTCPYSRTRLRARRRSKLFAPSSPELKFVRVRSAATAKSFSSASWLKFSHSLNK